MPDISNLGAIQPAESTRKYRRIVTAILPDNKEVIAEDAICPHRVVSGIDTMVATDFWKEDVTPVKNKGDYADKVEGFTFCPAPQGQLVRIIELPPLATYAPEDAPLDFHRTPTLDYGVILEGECYLNVGEDETLVHAGDVVIQRGTNHAWTNRSDKPVRIFFVMVGAEPVPGLDIF